MAASHRIRPRGEHGGEGGAPWRGALRPFLSTLSCVSKVTHAIVSVRAPFVLVPRPRTTCFHPPPPPPSHVRLRSPPLSPCIAHAARFGVVGGKPRLLGGTEEMHRHCVRIISRGLGACRGVGGGGGSGLVALRPLSCVTSYLSFAAPINIAGKCGGSVPIVTFAAAADDATTLGAHSAESEFGRLCGGALPVEVLPPPLIHPPFLHLFQ